MSENETMTLTIGKTFQWIIGHRHLRVAKTYDEIRMLDKSQKQNEQPCVLNVKIAIIILKDLHVLNHSTSWSLKTIPKNNARLIL